ncbi:MAG: hypothetical protein JWN04_4331 [Myxococcaceae bacterium]|nr:hypothetical protein [Myxococcaceae bacterium]
MPDQNREVQPGPRAGTVRSGEATLTVPAGWVLLPPGDPGLTRRVKKGGPCWTMHERRGRKLFSLGLYAPAARIEAIRAELALERADPAYARKLERAQGKRQVEQAHYEEDFCAAIYAFLAFSSAHCEVAEQVARAITAHATPVGSGTVARTKRIPIEQRAEAATIAWLRHATTGYDNMAIPRVKGMRREVRRMLAERSRMLLGRYRRGEPIPAETCLLRRALAGAPSATSYSQAEGRPEHESPAARTLARR